MSLLSRRAVVSFESVYIFYILTFGIAILSILKKGVQNILTMTRGLSVSLFSCLHFMQLKLCNQTHKNLQASCFPKVLIFYHCESVFYLMSNVCMMSFHPFNNFKLFLCLKYISQRQHVVIEQGLAFFRKKYNLTKCHFAICFLLF